MHEGSLLLLVIEESAHFCRAVLDGEGVLGIADAGVAVGVIRLDLPPES